MKKLIVGMFALAVLLTANFAMAGEKGKPKAEKASVGMKIKLELSEKMLASLTEADFAELSKNAKAMKALNQIEWFVRRDEPGYQTQLKTFLFATDELVRTADEENIDGATLAFTQMTISCVNCHKAIRAD